MADPTTAPQTHASLRGAEFLVKESDPQTIFTPEDYTEEQVMYRQALSDWYAQHIDPIREKFDTEEGYALAPALLEQMGEMGFLGIGVPEEYGGIDVDFKSQLVIGEVTADGHAFSLTPGIQMSLGVAPVLLYGNDAQKQKYLPRIVTAEVKTCYCLTEPGSGSDASAAKTRATLSPDGSHYLLNGQKMWITSSGHADVFFVFCKIEDDEKLSCLIVEKAFGGLTLGKEEPKMGMKGSSTRQVFFENVPVPLDNLLGKRGGGFKMALNVLNTGRIKIATATSGSGKRSFDLGLQYALQRVQFGKAIIGFGAIQVKVAEMGARLYAMESIWCRIAHLIDEEYARMVAGGMDPLEAKYRSISEFAMECALAKVYNTEGEGLIVDESLQIHGGIGYSGDSEIETLYRNARSNRIYEGTSEINRILTPTMALRKVMKGELNLLQAATDAIQAVAQGAFPPLPEAGEDLAREQALLARLKQSNLVIAGMAVQKYMAAIQDQQEVLMHIADSFMAIYAFESALLRTLKHGGGPSGPVRRDMVRLLLLQAAETLSKAGREVMYAMGQGPEQQQMAKGIAKACELPPEDAVALRRRIAAYFAEAGAYRL